jgi:hypothetical protein
MRYEDRAFKGETLTLDGHDYINCTFENCTMVYSALPGPGGEITPLIAKGLTFRYEGTAKAVVAVHDKFIEAGAAMTPVDQYLRIGTSWFQRVEKPAHLGAVANNTEGLEVLVIPKAGG